MNLFTKLLTCIALITLLSCNDSAPETEVPHADSESVKTLSTDSVSDMPVQAAPDSTAKMPNAYDSTRK